MTTAHTGRADLAILGGGSATETLVRELDGSGLSIVVFEPDRVGGECPFVACMPSKAMLHDARSGSSWSEAVARRNEIAEHLDDAAHAAELAEHGVDLVRARGEVVAPGVVSGGGRLVRAEHIVLATGAEALLPAIDDESMVSPSGPVWTSVEAMTASELPERLVVVGGGVIGTECASLFARFGSEVTLVDRNPRSLPDAPPRVSELLGDALRDLGIGIHRGAEAARIRLADDGGAVVELGDGEELSADRVLVAIGRRPRTQAIGLEHLGLEPGAPLPVSPNGRVDAPGSVWAVGDVAGRGEYTHLANHHARVVADHLAGSATRRYDDVVLPACMFTDPPFVRVGPSWAELEDDDDVVTAGFDLATFPRSLTDELAPGHLWAAARRSTGCLVAASGIGPGFDELTHAVVVAIDGDVPVARLRQSMRAFPTIGEILGPVVDRLHEQLT